MKDLSIPFLVSAFFTIATIFSSVQAELPLDLGLAEPYAILAGSTVTSTGVIGTVVTGNIGIFPGTAITGFPPAVLNGAVDSANGASGGAQGALTTAYNVLAGKAFNTTLSNQDLGGMTLLPNVYKFDSAAAINGMLTLDAAGDAAAVWVFQIGTSLLVAEGSSIIFKDSIGNPDYVYWQVGSTATLAIGVPMVGNILALTSIIVNNGVTVRGRCLARNAEVTLDKSVIILPPVLSFVVKQIVSGISEAQFYADAELNSEILKSAIVETMPGVLPANIKDFNVSAGSASVRARRALSASSIVLDYNVVVTANKTAEQLQDMLVADVDDGTFTSNLQSLASQRGATALQNASSSSVETQNTSPGSTSSPTAAPSVQASASPSNQPTVTPSAAPSSNPSAVPSVAPSAASQGEEPLDLGLAASYVILAGSAVTSGGTVGTVVTGNIGIFPGTAFTGFPPGILNGAIDAANGASGAAQDALTTAYNVLAAKAFNTTLSNQDLGGMTLLPGVYKFDGGATLNGMLTLDAAGNASAVWMFQIGTTLLVAADSCVIFKDSVGNPDYVYWQVGSSVTVGAGASMVGNMLALTAITVNTGATVQGRCLARNAAVTMTVSTITIPSSSASPSAPTVHPSATPSANPSTAPSAVPSMNPSPVPTVVLTASPSAQPSVGPNVNPSTAPSVVPSANPSVDPTVVPSAAPSMVPSVNPSVNPTVVPSAVPSVVPSANPSVNPTVVPSAAPSMVPSANPSVNPTVVPSAVPSMVPSANPSVNPTVVPSAAPSAVPSANPSVHPSVNPSVNPSVVPTFAPTVTDSVTPSVSLTVAPSALQTMVPSANPTVAVTVDPSTQPTTTPTVVPSPDPSAFPSMIPSASTTEVPTTDPSAQPSAAPSANPSTAPSAVPSVNPSVDPTVVPSVAPSAVPSANPSVSPTVFPSATPTARPSVTSTIRPTVAVELEQPLDLGLAKPYAILAGSAVTSSGTIGTVVTGNIGIFPGTAFTGFPPGILNGAIDSANGAAGGAQGALTTAYNVLANKKFNTTLSNQDLGGMNLLPGVYKFDGGATLNGMLTLDAAGNASAVWVFQIGTSLLVAADSSVIFKNSLGNPDFVYWQVGSSATLGEKASMVGNILALTAITVNTGATVQGRCLARNAAVTMIASTITIPAKVAFTATQTVSGISLEQFNANPEVNTAILKEAVADSIPGVTPSNIQNFVASAGPTSAAATRSLRSLTGTRILATSSIVLKYDIVLFTTKTAEELQTQLKTAVNDGSFNTHLQAAATEKGATELQSATSNSIETETITTEPPAPVDSSSSKRNGLSEADIAGICIGIVLGITIIGAIVYWWFNRNQKVMVYTSNMSREMQEV